MSNALILFALGMLSKAKGQILRVAGILNVLFCDRYEDGLIHRNENIPIVITNAALKAAQDFVDTACQEEALLRRKYRTFQLVCATYCRGVGSNF